MSRRWWLVLFLLPAGAGLFLAGRWWLAERHFLVGASALKRRELPLARERLRRCLDLRPNHPNASLLAARAARLSGALDDAQSLLEAVPANRATDPDLMLERTLLNAQIGSLSRLDEDYLWSRALADETSPALLVVECLAPIYLSTYRLGEALRAADRWVELEPANSRALLVRAAVRLGMGHQDQAETDFRAALMADPDNDEAKLRLALFLLNRDVKQSLTYFRELHPRRPDDREVVLGLTRALHETLAPGAEELIKDWLRKHPNDAEALAQRGRIAMADQDWAEAAAFFNQSLENDPSDRDVVFQLHTCLSRQGKIDLANLLKERLDRLDADLEQLREWHKRAGERPTDPEPPYQAGLICLRNSQADEALRWFANALRRNPRHSPTHKALASHFEKIGDARRATHHRSQAGQHR